MNHSVTDPKSCRYSLLTNIALTIRLSAIPYVSTRHRSSAQTLPRPKGLDPSLGPSVAHHEIQRSGCPSRRRNKSALFFAKFHSSLPGRWERYFISRLFRKNCFLHRADLRDTIDGDILLFEMQSSTKKKGTTEEGRSTFRKWDSIDRPFLATREMPSIPSPSAGLVAASDGQKFINGEQRVDAVIDQSCNARKARQ